MGYSIPKFHPTPEVPALGDTIHLPLPRRARGRAFPWRFRHPALLPDGEPAGPSAGLCLGRRRCGADCFAPAVRHGDPLWPHPASEPQLPPHRRRPRDPHRCQLLPHGDQRRAADADRFLPPWPVRRRGGLRHGPNHRLRRHQNGPAAPAAPLGRCGAGGHRLGASPPCGTALPGGSGLLGAGDQRVHRREHLLRGGLPAICHAGGPGPGLRRAPEPFEHLLGQRGRRQRRVQRAPDEAPALGDGGGPRRDRRSAPPYHLRDE